MVRGRRDAAELEGRDIYAVIAVFTDRIYSTRERRHTGERLRRSRGIRASLEPGQPWTCWDELGPPSDRNPG